MTCRNQVRGSADAAAMGRPASVDATWRKIDTVTHSGRTDAPAKDVGECGSEIVTTTTTGSRPGTTASSTGAE